MVDRGNRRIQGFDHSGVWARHYAGDDTLTSPRFIAIDGQGNAYVADTHASVVQVYGPRGDHLDGIAVELDGFPAHPTHLTWAPDGVLYVRVSEHRQRAA